MTGAALLTPIDHVRIDVPESAASPATAVTPPLLRSVANELRRRAPSDAFAVLVAQFESHADHLEADPVPHAPTVETAAGVVTVTTIAPYGRILVVPAPACNDTTIGRHIAAGLSAGNQISLATFGPVAAIPRLFYEILTGVVTASVFTVLSPGSGWNAPGQQSVFVVTPDAAFADDSPWWRHDGGTADQAEVGELVGFYRRSTSIHVPFSTSPYRGFTS
jgi:hypothetical protein